MDKEVWQDIEGFNGRYSVSNMGRVRRNEFTITVYDKGGKRTFAEKILNQYDLASKRSDKGSDAYKIVLLTKDGEQKRYYVHRLVAQAFVPNDDPEHKTVIHHIDDSCSNNRADNLRWLSDEDNKNLGKKLKNQKKNAL